MNDVAEKEELSVAGAFRALGSETRLRILLLLCRRDRLCGDLVRLFDLSQSTVSHHLKALREAGIVEAEERGTATCYRVNRERLRELHAYLGALLQTGKGAEHTHGSGSDRRHL